VKREIKPTILFFHFIINVFGGMMKYDIADLRDMLISILGEKEYLREFERVKKEWRILNEKGVIIILAKEKGLIK